MSYPPPPGPKDWQGQPASQPEPAYGEQGPQAYGGYQTPGYGAGPDPYGPGAPTSGKATTSLVLGIGSLVLFCVGFLLGIPAIIVGLRARKEIRNSQGRLRGDGLALGGIITGILGTLVGLAVVALLVALVAVGGSLSEVVERSCDELAQDRNPDNDCPPTDRG